MSVLIAILALALFALVVFVVSAPLRAARSQGAPEELVGEPSTEHDAEQVADLNELHSERDAKYREIRDVELDFRTGKLSKEDYEAIDAQMRAEALEILDRLEAAEASTRSS